MALWVPDAAALDQQAAHTASLVRALATESGRMDYWNKRLKEIDQHLQLVKAQSNATHPGLKPGYFHVIRTAPGTPPSIHVHETPEGDFREPDEGLIRELQEGDMWNTRAMRAREERVRAEAQAKESNERRETEDRREEIRDRIKATFRPGVAIRRDV